VQPKASPPWCALQRFPEIEELNSVSGPVDYMAVIRCDTHARLDKLLDEIGMLDGVNHTRRRSCWRGRSTGDGRWLGVNPCRAPTARLHYPLRTQERRPI
jgi:hypothetical protein